MNKRGEIDWGMILYLILVMMFLVWGGYDYIQNEKAIKNKCLIKIAKDYCEEKGEIFDRIMSKARFDCREDIRFEGYNRYRFLKSDWEECLK